MISTIVLAAWKPCRACHPEPPDLCLPRVRDEAAQALGAFASFALCSLRQLSSDADPIVADSCKVALANAAGAYSSS